MVDVDVRVLSHLKEELAWTVDKRLWIISTIMLFKKQLNVSNVELLTIFAERLFQSGIVLGKKSIFISVIISLIVQKFKFVMVFCS